MTIRYFIQNGVNVAVNGAYALRDGLAWNAAPTAGLPGPSNPCWAADFDAPNHGLFIGVATSAPAYDATTQLAPVEAPAIQVNGVWTQQWNAPVDLNLAATIANKLGALEIYGTGKITVGTTVNGTKFDTDGASQFNLNSAYNLANSASSPATFNWWFSYGWVMLTKAQVLSDAPVVGAWVEANYANLGAHYAAISALTTVAAVAAYDFTTGWPA